MQTNKILEKDLKGYTGLIYELEREKRKYRELCLGIDGKGVRYDREPISTGPGKPTESQAVRIADSKRRMQSLYKEIARIEADVDGIEDATVRVAVKYIYFDGYSLSRTARILKKNRNTLSKTIKELIE
jgi:hypothetical protein